MRHLIGYDTLTMISDWYRIYSVLLTFPIGHFGVAETVIFKIRPGATEKTVKILFVYGRIRHHSHIRTRLTFVKQRLSSTQTDRLLEQEMDGEMSRSIYIYFLFLFWALDRKLRFYPARSFIWIMFFAPKSFLLMSGRENEKPTKGLNNSETKQKPIPTIHNKTLLR